MNGLLTDPLIEVLKRFAPDTKLGGAGKPPHAGIAPSAPLDRGGLEAALGQAQRRNTVRFAIILSFLGVGLLTLIVLSFVGLPGVKPGWLTGAGSIYSAGIGYLLLEIAKSWWRTDTILTVAQFTSPETLELIIADILSVERTARARGSKAKARPRTPRPASAPPTRD